MDSFTVNKIAGAVLGTCLVGMGIGIIAQEIFSPEPPKKPGYALPKGEAASGGETKPAETPLPILLSKADAKRGESDTKVCSACHNFNEGGGTKIGPDLYGVVNRDKGSVQGFDYSAGMKSKGGKWTFEDLNHFLTKPSAYVSGTKMGYPGEESPEKRADILAYLATLAKTPVPLPKPSDADKKAAEGGDKTAAAGKEGAKPAEGGGDIVKLIAAADPKAGEKDATVCKACHTVDKGGATLVGPPLYGVVDRPKASVSGFDYSAGLKAKGGKWTYADLNTWLTKPAAYVSGTKMGYPGEANDKKRAAIIAYLRTLADKPAPLDAGSDAKAAPAADKTAEADKGSAKPADAGNAGGGDIVKLIASADPKVGEKDATVCKACHTVDKGGATLVGPTLYGVVDRPKGSVSGFDYSAGLKAKGGNWTYADLNTWLTKPSAYVSGTKMGYPGEANEKKRAAIIAYLRTLADKPAPLDAGSDAKAAPAADKATDAKKPEDKPQTSGDKAGTSTSSGDKATTPPAGDKSAAPPPPPAPAKPDEQKKSDEQKTEAAPPSQPAKADASTSSGDKAMTPPAGDKSAAPPPPPAPAKPDEQKKSDEQKTEAAPPSQPAKADASSTAKSEDSAGRGPEPYEAADPITVTDPVAPASKSFDTPETKANLGDAPDAGDSAPEPYSAPAPGDADKT